MTRSVWVAGSLLLAACRHDAPPSSEAPPSASAGPATLIAKVPMFHDVAIADGAIHLMDGGIHGVQGHTLVVPARGEASWERRVDSLQPAGLQNAGLLSLDASERAKLAARADAMWALARGGTASYDAAIANGPPRWVWAIVLRRGGEVRVLSGGGMTPPGSAPEPARDALAWLGSRVDAASQAAR